MLKHKILFIHHITNTPYKHCYYNLLANHFEIHVIQLSGYSKFTQWEHLENKRYSEYIIYHGEISLRKKAKGLLRINKLVKKINPEAIISHGYHLIEFILIPLLFRKKITLCEIATTYVDKKRHFIKEKIKAIFLDGIFNYFLVYGKSSKKYLTNNLGINENNVFIRGNFSHLQFEKYVMPEFLSRAKRLLYIGRFSEEKNILTLINAFIDYLKVKSSNYKLILVGDGPLKQRFIDFVKDSGFKDNIEFKNHQNPDTLIAYYLNSRVFVLPSFSEPWGQVINEAIHFGLPIIISEKCGSVEDLCNEDNSKIFNPHKQQELTDIFVDLLEDEESLTKMSTASLKKIQDNSSTDLIKKQVDFFNKILGTKT